MHNRPPVCAIYFQDDERKLFVSLNDLSEIVGLQDNDQRISQSLPIYGPVDVDPSFIDAVSNASKPERRVLGRAIQGLLKIPISQDCGPVVQYRENNRTVSKKRLLSR